MEERDPSAGRRALGAVAVRMRTMATFCDLAAFTLHEIGLLFHPVGAALEIHDRNHPLVCIASEWFDAAVLHRYLMTGFQHDPCLALIRETLSPVVISDVLAPRQARELAAAYGCPDASSRHTTLAPLIGDGEMLGVVRVAFEREVSHTVREDLGLLAGYVSVRLAHLGFSRSGTPDPLGALTGRQLQVAHMVARGMRNAEIAAELGVSIDGVKKHVKLALDALDLVNRAELAAVVTRAASNPATSDLGCDPVGYHVLKGAGQG